ncbi:mechanosensitive ion channel domain-containing protein [Ferrimonas aestuarii]|uniref:Mechanosensitive ion channel n=1 Tax=Ferrimonas aestuarii TaxID=2569539 RepID=A0A4U1BNC9_9GAMM|nr:mechanosensitive ion channel domain-containing protein [Ferrimonas aestuarii]TKB53631.1 mechanosensitive ion channel [Ferrimonas aestuarii]
MWRFFVFCFALISITSVEANPLSLKSTITGGGTPQGPLTVEQWQQATALEQQKAHQYKTQLDEFAVQQQQILNQLQQPQRLPLDATQSVSQQLSLAHNLLAELKSSITSLSSKVQELRSRIDAIPGELEMVESQQKLAGKDANVIPERLTFLTQWRTTLSLEKESRPLELKLTQLRQKLVQAQLAAQEQLIEALNDKANQQRRQQSQQAIDASKQQDGPAQFDEHDPLLKDNTKLAQQLALINQDTERLVILQQKVEQYFQLQQQQLTKIKDQFEWMGRDATFGGSLLKRLRQLEGQQQLPAIDDDLTQSRLQKFDIEQQQSDIQYLINQNPDDPRMPLWQQQDQLLNQVLSALDQQMLELSRLNQARFEAAEQESTLKQLISERLFWLPNARAIDPQWVTQVFGSIKWLFTTERWQELGHAIDANKLWWQLWLVLMVFALVFQDLMRKPYRLLRAHQAKYVGNVTHDRFSDSLKALVAACAYSLIVPAPLFAASWQLYNQLQFPFAHAIGAGLLAGVFLYSIYWLVHQLSRPDGLFIAHFRRHPPLVEENTKFLRKLLFTAAPLLMLVRLCQESEVPLLHNSLGRAAFLIFCVLLARAYWRIIRIVDEYHRHHTQSRPNQHLLERLIWALLVIVPLGSLLLSAMGYYFTAFTLLTQVQLTVLLAIGFMLVHLMVKRWMLIQRRKLAFDRAKAKRAELLAQRERGEGNEPLEPVEDPQIDLDTISTQSLGLVRSLMSLGFILTLLAVWNQTHPAVFSSLDGIVLWTSSEVIGGIEQVVPITLLSVLAGGIILAFTFVTARNLPGMLELVLLQRLELTPGTGFAITTISRYLVLMLGSIIAFSTLGVAWSKLQWLVAALSVGLGFGLQEIFANFISGLIILFEKPIRIGDTVTIRDLTGSVSKIQTRATTIVDWDRKEIIVPNKAFITEQLVNWSLSDAITRVTTTVGVARDSDPKLVEALLHQAVKENPFSLSNPEPEIYFSGFGPHTQEYEIRVYTDEMGKRWPLRHELHQQITKKFKEAKVELAYPQMEIAIKSKAEMVDATGSLIR